MLGFGLIKLLFTLALIAAVWPNFRTGSKNMLLYQRLIGRKSV
jgi:hypothetical protein